MGFELFTYVIFALVAACMGFLPGYVIARSLTKLKDEELAMASFATSVFLIAMSEFAAYLLNADAGLFNIVAILAVIVVGGAYLFFSGKTTLAIRPHPVYAVVLLAFVAVLFLQTSVPAYTGAYWYGDWWMHYELGSFYANHDPLDTTWFPQHYTPTSRTPLFDIAGGFFLTLFSRDFWAFQISASMVSAAFLLPLFLMTRRLFSERAAWLALLLAMLSPMVLTNEMYTWPKCLLTFFVLATIYYYLELREQISERRISGNALAAVAFYAALAYMTHQTALFYLATIALDALILYALSIRKQGLGIRVRLGQLGLALLLFLLVIAPWHLWAFSTYGVQKTLSSSPAINDAFTSKDWLYDHGMNALASVLPVFQHEWYTRWFSTPQDFIKAVTCPNFECKAALYSVTIRYWFDTIPGGLTLSVTFALLGMLAYRIWKGGLGLHYTTNTFLALIPIVALLLGGVTAPMLDTKGWGSPFFLPAVALLIGVAGAGLAALGKWALALVLTGSAIEFILVKVSHLYLVAANVLEKFEGWNVSLKADNNLKLAYDFLGGQRLLLILFAIVVYAYVLQLLIARGRFPNAGRRAPRRRPSRRAVRTRRTPR